MMNDGTGTGNMNEQYFNLEPEVAGGFGEHTLLDTTMHPPVVHSLHYEFFGWVGDPIVASFPCFIVTEDARRELLALGATGITFDEVKITRSPEFKELYPGRKLPPFVRLKVHGIPSQDDFGITTVPRWRLIVSDRVVNLFLRLGMTQGILLPLDR